MIFGVCGSEARPGAGLWCAVSSIGSQRECVWLRIGPCVGTEGARRHQRFLELSSLSSSNSLSVHVELLKSPEEADTCLLSCGPGACLPDRIVNSSVCFISLIHFPLTLFYGLPGLVRAQIKAPHEYLFALILGSLVKLSTACHQRNVELNYKVLSQYLVVSQ